MRGLAEYVMSGRRQSATVAVLFGLIPMLGLLSGAVVALVTLRKGPQEGFLIMMWALLPAGLKWLVGDTAPVIMVVGVVILASVLRRSQSWQQTLLVLTTLGLLLQLSLPLQTDYVAYVQGTFNLVLDSSGTIPEAGITVEEAKADALELWMLLYGAAQMLTMLVCLMIGRYWQALLYNPGGFRQEFHNLRVDPKVMGALLALILAGLAGVLPPLDRWIVVFCVVPAICGLAVVHYVVAARKFGTGGLVLGYLLALMAPPLIVMLGLVDSLLDIRKRMTQ